ncbi:MAG: hypothetical protein ABSC54_06325 [Smithellaceae bacterium]
MNIIKKIALYFARKEYCRKAITEHADLSVFKERLSVRTYVGIFLIAFSYLIGLPAVPVLGIIATWLNRPFIGFIGIPVTYGISWLMFMYGMYLAGPKYMKALSSWTVRIILEKILGDEIKAIRQLPIENSESGSRKN